MKILDAQGNEVSEAQMATDYASFDQQTVMFQNNIQELLSRTLEVEWNSETKTLTFQLDSTRDPKRSYAADWTATEAIEGYVKYAKFKPGQMESYGRRDREKLVGSIVRFVESRHSWLVEKKTGNVYGARNKRRKLIEDIGYAFSGVDEIHHWSEHGNLSESTVVNCGDIEFVEIVESSVYFVANKESILHELELRAHKIDRHKYVPMNFESVGVFDLHIQKQIDDEFVVETVDDSNRPKAERTIPKGSTTLADLDEDSLDLDEVC